VRLVFSRPAPPDHAVVRITLADGRVVSASRGHPDPTGRPLADLQAGDRLDGSPVVRVELVPLAGERTWDLLVSGPTGLYFADGVALRSTLRPASP
jgi:hypothetical protein